MQDDAAVMTPLVTSNGEAALLLGRVSRGWFYGAVDWSALTSAAIGGAVVAIASFFVAPKGERERLKLDRERLDCEQGQPATQRVRDTMHETLGCLRRFHTHLDKPWEPSHVGKWIQTADQSHAELQLQLIALARCSGDSWARTKVNRGCKTRCRSRHARSRIFGALVSGDSCSD